MDVIRSSGKPIDRSWQATFAPSPDLRARAIEEFRRLHAIEHAASNSMFRCGVCHGWPDVNPAATES